MAWFKKIAKKWKTKAVRDDDDEGDDQEDGFEDEEFDDEDDDDKIDSNANIAFS